MFRVEVIVNKNWETEPVLNAMTNPKLRPIGLPFPVVINTPKDGNNRMNDCRAVYRLSNIDVIVRCIEDLMDPKKNPSSSEEKFRVLPPIIALDNPDCVISVSTAELAYDNAGISQNGFVFIGGSFFLHNGRPDNPLSNVPIPKEGEFYKNNVDKSVYAIFDDKFSQTVTAKFIPLVKNPAKQMMCLASPDYTAIGNVNVTDYSEYKRTDQAAREHFDSKHYSDVKPISIETTHGVVRRSIGNIPMLFVSPITDRYLMFDEDVTDTQNYSASFNAGLVVGEMLVSINRFLSENKDFGFMA